MKNILKNIMKNIMMKAKLGFVGAIGVLLVSSCGKVDVDETEAVIDQEEETMVDVEISWVDFIVFEGITYEAIGVYDPDEVWAQLGAKQKKMSLGKEFGVVAFNVSDNIHDSSYQLKDGDAAFLPEGTKVYELDGYLPSFRLALKVGELIKIYEVSENDAAKYVKDLFDIEGKVSYITINSEVDGTTVLAKIDHPETVSLLEKELLATPLENMRLLLDSKEGETKWSNDRQGIRYFLTFNLLDGTFISKSYWINTGAFGSNISLGNLFKEKVNEALDKSPYTLGNTLGILEPLVLTGEMFEVSITIEPEIKAGTPMTITSKVKYLGNDPATFEGGVTVTEIYLLNANNVESSEMAYESMAQSLEIQPGHIFTDTRTINLNASQKGLHTLFIRTSWMTIDGVYYQGVGYENTLAYQKENNNPPLTDELESLYQSTFETRIPIFITYDE